MYNEKEKINLLKILIKIEHCDSNTVSATFSFFDKMKIFEFNSLKLNSRERKIITGLCQVLGLPTSTSKRFRI